MEENKKHWDLTDLIIKGFFKVYNKLEFGFLEKVYQNSLCIQMAKLGLSCEKNFPIDVYFDNQVVGTYFADIIINRSVIIEVKAAECLCEAHEAQLTNYLRATDIEVGMLLNFGKKPEYKRKVFSSRFKNLNKS